jgi:Ca2+-binding RTX toxin-like protein
MPLIKAKTRSGDATPYVLTTGQDLIVAKGVKVESFLDDAILSASGAHNITIAGSVIGYDSGVVLQTGGQGTNRLTIEETGTLIGRNGTAVSFDGKNAILINKGRLIADEGISFGWEDASNGTAKVVNSGTIHFTDNGIYTSENVALNLQNTGVLYMIDNTVIDGGDLRDVLVNRGEIYGYTSLRGGNDLYDGRGGFLSGGVYGDDGNDVFRPGRGAEYLDGGNDFDTVDYSSGGAVFVNLDGNTTGRKAAAGDVLQSFERVIGSAKGDDKIYGNYNTEVHERLEGLGGQDSLYGGGGNDTLIGGMGRDLIEAGTLDGAVDYIVFNNAAEGGDRVSFFQQNDVVLFDRDGFGGGLAPGWLAVERLHKGATNTAQDANDRFIFRTTDDTLWFDKDGSKGKFAPVLIAKFVDADFFASNNIFIA